MRYDDPARPISDLSATKQPLQVNGSPLPSITLMYPMQNGGEPAADGEVDVDAASWGWLCAIHAHRGANRFGTHYAWLRDLGAFQRDYLSDPEAALLRYFRYSGPELEQTEHAPHGRGEIAEDIFGGGSE